MLPDKPPFARTLTLPRWFAMTLFPFEVASARRRIIQAPHSGQPFHTALPLPLYYRMPNHNTPALAGEIDDVYVDGTQLRAAGKFRHDQPAGTHLAFRLLCGEQIPVAAHTYTTAYDYHLAELLRECDQTDPLRFSGWQVCAVSADPPGGAAWEESVMWRV